MRFLLPISLSLLLFVTQTVCAQLAPADDFFNQGAQLYISNNIPSALGQVESGLKYYPEDEKLKKLEELLKQKQQQQQNQQQQNQKDQSQDQKQQNQSQQQKDQQSQQQKSDEQKKQQQDQNKASDQQKKDEPKQSEADQKKSDEEKKQEQQKSAAEKKEGGKPEDQKGEGQPVASGQMTPEEAKRLLDAQKGDEQVLKLQPKDKPQDSKRLVKDW
jgi:Ca-activated chloride channel family protein